MGWGQVGERKDEEATGWGDDRNLRRNLTHLLI